MASKETGPVVKMAKPDVNKTQLVTGR